MKSPMCLILITRQYGLIFHEVATVLKFLSGV